MNLWASFGTIEDITTHLFSAMKHRTSEGQTDWKDREVVLLGGRS